MPGHNQWSLRFAFSFFFSSTWRIKQQLKTEHQKLSFRSDIYARSLKYGKCNSSPYLSQSFVIVTKTNNTFILWTQNTRGVGGWKQFLTLAQQLHDFVHYHSKNSAAGYTMTKVPIRKKSTTTMSEPVQTSKYTRELSPPWSHPEQTWLSSSLQLCLTSSLIMKRLLMRMKKLLIVLWSVYLWRALVGLWRLAF